MFSNNLQIYRYNRHKEANNRAKQRHTTKMPINDEYFDKIEENLLKQMSKNHILYLILLNMFENTLMENKEHSQLEDKSQLTFPHHQDTNIHQENDKNHAM